DIFGLSDFYFHKSKLEWIDHEFITCQCTCFHLPSSTHFLSDVLKPSSSTLEFQEYSPNLCHISMYDSAMFLSSVSCSRPLWGFPALSSAPSFFPPRKHHERASGISASLETENLALTGVVFQPFEELKKEDFDIPVTHQVSLALQIYTDDCEAAINEQINVEYSMSYVYHSLYSFFDRDNIALKGLTKLSRNLMKEKIEHAKKLMEYQNIRGGRVKLHPILMPLSEFEHAEKGDTLYGKPLCLFSLI
ncbi:hypothetical protein Golob_002704, partial [Gossypium lobatum]|nr:hypothetical protein [Gossypium lobatum]